jgi:hypothetical protein
MSLASRRLLAALRLLALVSIGASLAAPRLTEQSAWGLWPSTYLPADWRWGLALVAAALALFGDRLGDRLGGRLFSWRLPGVHWPAAGWRWVLAACCAAPFYLFRIVHTRWGDAYILVKSIAHPTVRLTYTWQAPLDVFIHAKLWALGARLWGWTDAMPAYWIISPFIGVLFVWVLLSMAQEMGRNRTERWVLCGLVMTLGTMQLFFGYIEDYTVITLGVLIYAWLALRYLRGRAPLWQPAVALALSHAFHPATLVLAPSLLYLAWLTPCCASGVQPYRTVRTGGRRALLGRLLVIAAPYVVVGGSLLAFMTAGGHGLSTLLGAEAPGGGDHRWMVPLVATTTQWEHYTMFSLGHLLDIINEQLLSAPVIWPALLLAVIFGWNALRRSLNARPRSESNELIFLSLAVLSYVLLIVTWNADYGGQRDWDLFSVAAVPAALLAGYVLPRALPERPALGAAGWALVAAQAVHTVAWIYQNTRPWSWG